MSVSALPNLLPPFNFCQVEEGVYRGAYPTLANLRFLRRLRLTTLVSLTPEPPTADVLDFCRDHGIVLEHFMVDKHQESKVVFDASQIAKVIKVHGR